MTRITRLYDSDYMTRITKSTRVLVGTGQGWGARAAAADGIWKLARGLRRSGERERMDGGGGGGWKGGGGEEVIGKKMGALEGSALQTLSPSLPPSLPPWEGGRERERVDAQFAGLSHARPRKHTHTHTN